MEKCHKVEESCICILDKGHAKTLHKCKCSGSWGYDEEGKFILGNFPDISNSYPLTDEEKEIINNTHL